MRRIRMEGLDIEDVDPRMLIITPPTKVLSTEPSSVDWLCGHCEETLVRRAGGGNDDFVVFRCPHCQRFSRLRQVQ